MKIVLSFVFQMNHHFFYRSFKRQKAANLHKTSGVCSIIFVIFWPTFIQQIFLMPTKNKGAEEKTEHCNLTRKFACLWKCKFASTTLFLEAASWIFLLQKIHQMKAGQNNKYDITKTWSLVQVWFWLCKIWKNVNKKKECSLRNYSN